MGYIATCAARQGYNVGVIDAEALGLGISGAADLVNRLAPRWAGFNLLAPTYEISAQIATGLDPAISIMVGGHQARAMPIETLTDPRFARCEALVLGEGETRVAELLRTSAPAPSCPALCGATHPGDTGHRRQHGCLRRGCLRQPGHHDPDAHAGEHHRGDARAEPRLRRHGLPVRG
jgi:hypothetical protein